MWNASIEGQGKEYLLRHVRKHQFRRVPETEFAVVIRMSDKATTPCIHASEPCKPFLDQRLADALSLIRRQD